MRSYRCLAAAFALSLAAAGCASSSEPDSPTGSAGASGASSDAAVEASGSAGQAGQSADAGADSNPSDSAAAGSAGQSSSDGAVSDGPEPDSAPDDAAAQDAPCQDASSEPDAEDSSAQEAGLDASQDAPLEASVDSGPDAQDAGPGQTDSGPADLCTPSCSPGESCCSGVCTPGFCPPDVLLSGISPASSIVPDEDKESWLFWSSSGSAGVPAGLFAAHKDGSHRTQIYPADSSDAHVLAVDSMYLYWSSRGVVKRGTKEGTDAHPLVDLSEESSDLAALGAPFNCLSAVRGAAADSDFLYVALTGCASVVKVAKMSGLASILVPAPDYSPGGLDRIGTGVALDATHVYSTRGLWRAGKDGSLLVHLGMAPEDMSYEGLVVDGSHIYTKGNGVFRRLGIDGSNLTAIASWPTCNKMFAPTNVTQDQSFVYWLEQCSTQVHRTNKATGHDEVIFDDPEPNRALTAIANDTEWVYWSDYLPLTPASPARMMRWKKP